MLFYYVRFHFGHSNAFCVSAFCFRCKLHLLSVLVQCDACILLLIFGANSSLSYAYDVCLECSSCL